MGLHWPITHLPPPPPFQPRRSKDVGPASMGPEVWSVTPPPWSSIPPKWPGGVVGMELWSLKSNMPGMVLGGRGSEWGVRALVAGIRVYEHCLGECEGDEEKRMKVEGWCEGFVQDVVKEVKDMLRGSKGPKGSTDDTTGGGGIDGEGKMFGVEMVREDEVEMTFEGRRDLGKTVGEMLEWGRERMEEVRNGWYRTWSCRRDNIEPPPN